MVYLVKEFLKIKIYYRLISRFSVSRLPARSGPTILRKASSPQPLLDYSCLPLALPFRYAPLPQASCGQLPYGLRKLGLSG